MCRIIPFIILTTLFTSSSLEKSSVKGVVTEEDVKLFEKIANSSGRPMHLVVRHDGYPAEMHNVTTEDGYRIGLLRIPYGKSKQSPKILRRAVLLICGYVDPLLACLYLQEDSLPYLLADAGFDVWIGDFRGTPLSSHVKYSKNDSKFWDYSLNIAEDIGLVTGRSTFQINLPQEESYRSMPLQNEIFLVYEIRAHSHDEIGYYDVPAFIDYILGVTGRRRLNYVGISYGSQLICVTLADRPEYNQKLRKIAYLAPTVVTSHMKSMTFIYSAMLSGLTGDILGEAPWKFPLPEKWPAFYHRICDEKSQKPKEVCPTFYAKLVNFMADPAYEDQLRNDKFAHYDYGAKENQRRYGSKNPPVYDLKKVSVPSMTIFSDGDGLSPPEDALAFYKSLGKTAQGPLIRIKETSFAHVDMLANRTVRKLAYDPVVRYFSF